MRRLGVLIAMALILAACGDDDGNDDATTRCRTSDEMALTDDNETTQGTTGREVTPTDDETTLSPRGVEVTLTVTATDFAFDPVDPVVEVGESSTVHLINRGSNPHTWVVLRQCASAEQYIESIDSATTTAARRDAEEGQTLVKVGPAAGPLGDPVTFTIDKAGTYEVVCDIPEHFEKGMEGTLVVE
jgi:plastocyanin